MVGTGAGATGTGVTGADAVAVVGGTGCSPAGWVAATVGGVGAGGDACRLTAGARRVDGAGWSDGADGADGDGVEAPAVGGAVATGAWIAGGVAGAAAGGRAGRASVEPLMWENTVMLPTRTATSTTRAGRSDGRRRAGAGAPAPASHSWKKAWSWRWASRWARSSRGSADPCPQVGHIHTAGAVAACKTST